MESGYLEVFGARGTYPAARPEFMRYGGNTTCFALPLSDRVIVFDAGSGASVLALELLESADLPRRIDFLFTHFHFDHVCGFPSFAPLYDEGFEVHIHLNDQQVLGEGGLRGLFQQPWWPIGWAELESSIEFESYSGGLDLGGVCIGSTELHHPGSSLAFRVQCGERAVVIATDHEHGTAEHEALAALCQGADAVIYDAHFTPDEYSDRIGWGHSTWRHGLRLIEAASARRLLLTHHDPRRTDDAMDAILSDARKESDQIGAAHEGLQIPIAPEATQ